MTAPEYVRVPISTPRVSPVAFARNVWRFSTGQLTAASGAKVNAMTFAPLAVKDSGAAWVFDRGGLRLVGYPRLPLAIGWSELRSAELELQESATLGLQVLRIVLQPHDPTTFTRAHPGVESLWDPTVSAWSAIVSKGPQIPEETIRQTEEGLALGGHGPRAESDR